MGYNNIYCLHPANTLASIEYIVFINQKGNNQDNHYT